MEKGEKVAVDLIGKDGNAFNILGLTMRALRKGGYTDEEVKAYEREATAGDYDNLLQVTMRWVDVI